MEDIRRSKLNLVEWLTNDPDFILQVVQEDVLITQREYQKLKAENDPEKRIINLLDIIMGKGNSSCELFIHALQKDKVKETYPKLIKWLSSRQQGFQTGILPDVETGTLLAKFSPVFSDDVAEGLHVDEKQDRVKAALSGTNLSGRQIITADVHAAGGSFVVCPVIQTDQTSSISIPVNVNPSRNNKSAGNNLPLGSTKEVSVKELEDKVTDKKLFLKRNWANLVQKVKKVDGLADQMMGYGLTNEMYSEIMSCQTSEEKMRKLLQYSTTTDMASGHLFTALCTLHNYVIQELTQ